MEPLVLIALSCSQVRDLIRTIENADHLPMREKIEIITRLEVRCPPWLPDTLSPDHSLGTYHERVKCTRVRL